MKKILLLLFLPVMALHAAPALPSLGDARIVVLANNLQNYYYNYWESDRPSYDDAAGFELKTSRIVDMIIASEADIFAFCEVEAKPITLDHLAEELNRVAGVNYYAAVSDGIYVETDSYDNAIKSGFVYRSDKVKPYGDDVAATNSVYYKNTMRIQAWEELSSGERFTLSMNHFKAGQNESDKNQRVKNANWLMSALSSSSKVKDPDILIMGDLNCQMYEDAIAIIEDHGYEEQLLRFDENAYSYIYKGSRELIDHAFANSTMAEQITGAAVWHTNTSVSYSNRYSDHDAVLVGLRLGDEQSLEPIRISDPSVQKILRNGQLIILRSGVEYTPTGQRL